MSAPGTTAAILLAAGRGERMGGPKALLMIDEEPLVLLHARRLLQVAARVIVLVPPGLARGAGLAWPAGVTLRTSHAPDPAGSLAVGVAALADLGTSPSVVVVAPVDALPVREDTLRALLAAMTDDVDAASPTHHGRGGHPVVVRAAVLGSEPPGARGPLTLRDRLAALGKRRVRVACADPAVVSSLNTPADLRARGLDLTFAPGSAVSAS